MGWISKHFYSTLVITALAGALYTHAVLYSMHMDILRMRTDMEVICSILAVTGVIPADIVKKEKK